MSFPQTLCSIYWHWLLLQEFRVTFSFHWNGQPLQISGGGNYFEVGGGQVEANSGEGFLGRGLLPPPHQLGGLGERCKLPQWGSGQSPDRKCILGS